MRAGRNKTRRETTALTDGLLESNDRVLASRCNRVEVGYDNSTKTRSGEKYLSVWSSGRHVQFFFRWGGAVGKMHAVNEFRRGVAEIGCALRVLHVGLSIIVDEARAGLETGGGRAGMMLMAVAVAVIDSLIGRWFGARLFGWFAWSTPLEDSPLRNQHQDQAT